MSDSDSSVVLGADPVAVLDFPALRDDLSRVDSLLVDSPRSSVRLVAEASTHLLQAGGKRLRPLLTFVGAYAVRADGGRSSAGSRVAHAAASVELLHIGSLQHDDVMDEAVTRRGVPSVNARWGNLMGVLIGDVLLARSAALAASLGAREARLHADTLVQLAEGQVLEAQDLFNRDRGEDAYFRSIGGKTASLMGASCELGGMAAGGSDDQINALRRYGYELGIAFQIMDDVLDIISTEEELGKPTGKDVVEGVYTLPVIKAAKDSEELRQLLSKRSTPARASRIKHLVVSSGAVPQALEAAHAHVAAAGDALQGTIDPSMRGHLVRLLQALIPARGPLVGAQTRTTPRA